MVRYAINRGTRRRYDIHVHPVLGNDIPTAMRHATRRDRGVGVIFLVTARDAVLISDESASYGMRRAGGCVTVLHLVLGSNKARVAHSEGRRHAQNRDGEGSVHVGTPEANAYGMFEFPSISAFEDKDGVSEVGAYGIAV
ncbi:hypothetical protein B0H16DRAFT_1694415 [Mycena metata]|uniref:Uncharacterized protein n=1 Tax=Mycena metata TaxID=1033252 RepID=A0AAD7IDX7_9AGAR|nr:hypothetical protein B0H16DRAFT_1694415 [Mycena metata]